MAYTKRNLLVTCQGLGHNRAPREGGNLRIDIKITSRQPIYQISL